MDDSEINDSTPPDREPTHRSEEESEDGLSDPLGPPVPSQGQESTPADPEDGVEPMEEEASEPSQDARPKSWRRRVFKIALSAFITLFLLVITLEVMGRAVPPLFGPEIGMFPVIGEPDPNIGRRLRPGNFGEHHLVTLEGLPPEVGLRETATPSPFETRVLAVGDSFTFGDAVDLKDNWTELLEASMEVSVINAGMGGTGPDWSYRFLHHYGWGLKPDLVLFALFAGNDVLDAGRSDGASIRTFGSARHWLQSHSVTYRAAKKLGRLFISAGHEEMEQHTTLVNGEEVGFWPSMVEYNARITPTEDYAKALTACQDWIGKMAAECREKGIPFAVVIFPYKEQVYFSNVTQWIARPGDYDPAEPNRTLERYCREKGIPVKDLLAHFVSEKHRNLYGAKDSHWNREGYAHAAAGMKNFIRDLLDRAASARHGTGSG